MSTYKHCMFKIGSCQPRSEPWQLVHLSPVHPDL